METYQYLHSNKVGHVVLKEVRQYHVCFKADIEQSPTLPHHLANAKITYCCLLYPNMYKTKKNQQVMD